MSDEALFTSRHLTARDYGKLFGLPLGGLLGLTAWILLCPGGVECADLLPAVPPCGLIARANA
jgi:hypothetical protein